MLCQIPGLRQVGHLSSPAAARTHGEVKGREGMPVCANLLANNTQTAIEAAPLVLLWPCRVVPSAASSQLYFFFLVFFFSSFSSCVSLRPSRVTCRRRRGSSSCPEVLQRVASGWLATNLASEIKPRFIVVVFPPTKCPPPPLSRSCSGLFPC